MRARSDQNNKVLFVSFVPYLGGAQMSLLTILETLTDGVYPVLACPPDGPLAERALQVVPSLELLPLQQRSEAESRVRKGLRWAWSILRWTAANRSQLLAVHANGDPELKICVLSLLVFRLPVVVWFHSKILSPSTIRLAPLWRALRHRVLWAPVSSWLRGEGIRHGLFGFENSIVIPNPIDPVALMAPQDGRPSEGPVSVGYLGFEFEDKGIVTLASIAEQMRDDPVRFHVVTKERARDMNSTRVNEALDRLRALTETVEMRPRSSGGAIYEDMDILLIPSQAESFCRIAAEAMMNGIPVAATRLPALLEVVGNDEAGLLFPVDDAESAVRALRRLTGDPDFRRHLGDVGKSRAQRYLPDEVVAQLMAAYRTRFPLRNRLSKFAEERPGARDG